MGLSVEVMPDSDAPQVGITVDGLDDQAPSVISVEVSWDDGVTWHGVRGAREITALGGTFVRDHACPLNAEARYRLVVHSGAVTPSPTEATITVPSDVAWLQDPLAPRTAVAIRADLEPGGVLLTQGSLAEATWAQPTDIVMPEGAQVPVASIGQRLLAGRVPLVLTHRIAQDGGTLRRLLLGAGTVLLRGLPSNLLEPVAHVVVGPAHEQQFATHQLSQWSLVVDQVRPPALSLVVPWWTYDQVKAAWEAWAVAEATTATYANVLAARPGDTYLDWLRSPEPS